MSSKILQCRMSPELSKHFSYFMKKYGFDRIADRKKPAVFFGMYRVDIEKLFRHKSLAVIIWAGSDIMVKERFKKVCSHPNVRHIALSSITANDLEKGRVQYKLIPLSPVDTSLFRPAYLGDSVFAYIPSGRYEFYGGPIIKQIKKKCKYNIIIADSLTKYSRKQIRNIFKRSFLCLRLTRHDGLPNTVIEFGLMGRRSIFNCEVPGAISYDINDIDSIIDNIYKEAGNIGKINYDLVKQWRNFMNVSKDWCYKDFWQ